MENDHEKHVGKDLEVGSSHLLEVVLRLSCDGVNLRKLSE
jgi:hypothetical protein